MKEYSKEWHQLAVNTYASTVRVWYIGSRTAGEPVCDTRRAVDCMMGIRMDLKAIPLEIPADANIIVGQSHFIKTVEDIYEAIVGSVPQMKFGVAFNEASGPCLTRVEGNDDELKAAATRNAIAIGAGHTFVVVLR